MRFVSFAVLFLLLALPCFAECTAEQWKTDLELYQKYLGSTPKDYLGAVNLNRKWIGYANEKPAQVKEFTGGLTADQLQGTLNNVYRETAQVLVNDYSSLMKTDPLKAAQLGIDVRKFFKENPAIMKEFAGANGTTPQAMQGTLIKAVNEGFMETYSAMAAQYSQLTKAGKTAEAEKVSSAWNTVIADLEAHGSKLPDQFRKFTGVDITKTVADVKELEADLKSYHEAVKKGDFKGALDLVKKWEDEAKNNPSRVDALNFVFNASTGVKKGDKADWTESFKSYRAQAYSAMFDADLKAYQTAIAEGKLDAAKALINKWKEISSGDLAEAIAAVRGADLKTFKQDLEKSFETLSKVDPSFSTENVVSFKKDLAEYEACVKAFQAAAPGSDDWYKNIARAAELADKWSRITKENPALAKEIEKATGIVLPMASDNVIKIALDTAIVDSAAKFNAYLGAGQFAKAKELVKSWKEYLEKHPRVKELALEKWGKDFFDTLDRYEAGLTIMISGTPTTAPGTPPVVSDPPAGDQPAVDTTGNETGLGPSAN